MSLYAIGDLHLCLGAYKPMDVFGGRWEGYMEKLREGLSVIEPGDTTVLLGDLSWALGIEQAEKDFAFLHEIPGRKIILKGNHDYWWTTATKFYHFCAARGWDDMFILNNNCYFYGETALCGTRGWFYEQEQEGTHRYRGYECPEILALLARYGVRQCFYGHLHAESMRLAIQGSFGGCEFRLLSADYVNFRPQKLLD